MFIQTKIAIQNIKYFNFDIEDRQGCDAIILILGYFLLPCIKSLYSGELRNHDNMQIYRVGPGGGLERVTCKKKGFTSHS